MFPAHVFFCYCVFLSGIGCMITRLVPGPPEWRIHSWCGWAYIISMIWAMATSLLIHNTGLPPAVLVSFIWVLGGLTVGWFLIRLHMANMDTEAYELAKKDIMSGTAANVSLPTLLAMHKADIGAKKSFMEQFFSYKVMHACCMITSWINIAGRIFNSDQNSANFACWTTPVHKPIFTSEHGDYRNTTLTNLTVVNVTDADYARYPWAKTGLVGWGALLSIIPSVIVASVYACSIYFYMHRMKPLGTASALPTVVSMSDTLPTQTESETERVIKS